MLILIILFLLSITQNCSSCNFIIKRQLSKLVSKGFEIPVYWNEYKTKSENKNTTNQYRYFAKSYFVGVNRLFALIYTNQDVHAKRFNALKYYLPKSIVKL